MTKIKECPFCGKSPHITKHFKEDMWRLTHRCQVIGPILLDWREIADELVAVWNTRNP